MAEKGTGRGDECELASAEMFHHQHRQRALERIAKKRCGCETLASGAQHIGGADIAGADGADVGGAGKPRQDEAEWDRAAEIAERERDSRGQ